RRLAGVPGGGLRRRRVGPGDRGGVPAAEGAVPGRAGWRAHSPCGRGGGTKARVFRVDEGTVAVVLTPAAVADVLDRRDGRKKSKAPTAVVEGVRAIDRAATPIWLVVGENRVGGRVEHSRMVATVALKEDATLRVRMETPDAAAAGRCRKTLELYA